MPPWKTFAYTCLCFLCWALVIFFNLLVLLYMFKNNVPCALITLIIIFFPLVVKMLFIDIMVIVRFKNFWTPCFSTEAKIKKCTLLLYYILERFDHKGTQTAWVQDGWGWGCSQVHIKYSWARDQYQVILLMLFFANVWSQHDRSSN